MHATLPQTDVLQADVLQELKRRLQRFTSDPHGRGEASVASSTGISGLDRLLPQQGVPPASLVEWVGPSGGAGCGILALAGVRALLQRPGWWVVIDPRGDFYPPAVEGWGIALNRLVLIRPGSSRDAFWAFEQAVRCPGVAVTWSWSEHIPERVLQRWKVALECGGGQGVVFRPPRALQQSSWADIRWHVTPYSAADQRVSGHDFYGRRWRVELQYCRGVWESSPLDVEYHDETGAVRVVSQLAHSKPVVRAARA